ncbi:autophagy-related protein 13-domain-containing protein [Zychaea mexicana]|uniref:autophagy-related protein 13-domain-containing protein n=1 Tax=Zychaea mexicana TaxID=64656 RepID=UPI0022FDD1F8|nr:autophagy-related protein 13-domain-containing protein [Zychaea mexicana]KAI9488025.1 autophagy-related protein 13-domain-containing protein [Zychaea mexicana]
MSFPGNPPASSSNPMQAGPRSYQSSPVAPTGPSASTSFNTRHKLEHIVQNFYTKTAQVVVQARLDPEQQGSTNRRSSSSSSTLASNSSKTNKPNKWFNIATQDIDFLREELKFWRALSIQSEAGEPPPLILDVVLDVSQLTQSQILVLADDPSRLNKVDINGVETILLERWVLSLNHPLPDFSVDLPNLYKRSIAFFRALYSFVRLLPCYSLHGRLCNYGQLNGLALNYRLTSTPTYRNDEIPLDQPMLRGGATDEYEFSNVVTPLGTFKLHVEYRKNCDFRLEDSERDLSARMIDMDEHFFTPTMVQHRQEQHPRAIYPHDEEATASRHAHRNSPPYANARQSSTDSSDPREIIQQQQRKSSMGFRGGSPTSVSPLNRETGSSLRASPVKSSTTAVVGTPPTSTKRRTSAPHMSPFKSPSLSSSPQAEALLSSGVRPQASPSERTRALNVESSSSTSRNKVEFSPSFDKIQSSPGRTETSMMTRRWSRASDHSSINNFSTDDPELEEFIRAAAAKPDLKLAQSRASNSSQMMESANLSPTSETSSSLGASGYGSGSIYRSKKALSHYKNLRDTHNTLSESLSSSVLTSGERQESSPAVGTSLGSSSTSSNSRPYLPAVRSPLHSEGSASNSNNPSTSPMHIPRSHHRHSLGNTSDTGNNTTTTTTSTTSTTAAVAAVGSHTATTTATTAISTARQHRRYHSSQNAKYNKEAGDGHDCVNDVNADGAFSSYPQDRHHDELRRLCVLESDSSSSMIRRQESLSSLQDDSHAGLQSSGSVMHNQGGRASSLDDDDSLVFKMSELEAHHPADESNDNIVLHGTRDYARRLGINSPSSRTAATTTASSSPSSPITTTTMMAASSPITTTAAVGVDPNAITPVRRISSSTSIPQTTVAMATVVEEEERSASASNSSSKSDPHSKYPRDFW